MVMSFIEEFARLEIYFFRYVFCRNLTKLVIFVQVLTPLLSAVVSVSPSKNLKATIPDKRAGTRSKFSPPPTFNIDNQEIFFPLCWKKVTFSNID